MTKLEAAQYIDHTYLKAEGTKKHIDKLISEAIEYKFKTICINPS
jgi:deoxyribose-phosphate aldolase